LKKNGSSGSPFKESTLRRRVCTRGFPEGTGKKMGREAQKGESPVDIGWEKKKKRNGGLRTNTNNASALKLCTCTECGNGRTKRV